MSPEKLVVDVVSDVVCPWCLIGKRRIEKAIAMKPEIAVELRFRPYFLNDWIPREGISRNDYLTAKFGSVERYKEIAKRVTAAAAEEGLSYAADKISRQPNTLDCHRLILWAGRNGNAPQMKQRLMDLYFSEGADLTDRKVLAQAAVDCGMERERSRTPARKRRGRRARDAGSGVGQGRGHRGRAVLYLWRRVGGLGRAIARISRRGNRARGSGTRQTGRSRQITAGCRGPR